MDNPFETIEITSKPRIKRKFKLEEMFKFFPEESSNSIDLKLKISKKVKEYNPKFSDFQVFKTTQMLFNQYFYKLTYYDNQTIEKFVASTELFKTI